VGVAWIVVEKKSQPTHEGFYEAGIWYIVEFFKKRNIWWMMLNACRTRLYYLTMLARS